jgi:hypothetical protein
MVNYYVASYTELLYREIKPEHHWKEGKNLVYIHLSTYGMVSNKCSSPPVRFHVFINKKCSFTLLQIIYKSAIVFAAFLIICNLLMQFLIEIEYLLSKSEFREL